MSFMTPEIKGWISAHSLSLIGICFVSTTVLMQLLHWFKVNVLKVIVLLGTFALAMAFAGNDLVNFIGIPVTGFDSYREFAASGGGDAHSFMMDSLNKPGTIPIVFLIGAGLIMIVSLIFSKKARDVVNTTVNLARQDAGEENFGSSKLARALVRQSIKLSRWIVRITPESLKRWSHNRLDTSEAILIDGASFDLLRGCINLVLAGALIAFGTSLQLPLSTTYVTFMVAMGTSLADRAWGRESAVFRITGVISVIGGWFITAGAAFIGTAIIVVVMHIGGLAAITITAILAIVLILCSNLKKQTTEDDENLRMFEAVINAHSKDEAWQLLKVFLRNNQLDFLQFAANSEKGITDGFIDDNVKMLGQSVDSLKSRKNMLKIQRRRSMLCFQSKRPKLRHDII